MSQKIIIVSNRLPVTIQQSEDKFNFMPSAGGLATGLGSIYRKGDNLWIGWPGLYDLTESDEQYIGDELKKDYMAPVYLSKQDIQDYYEGFSNRTIWPLFHYFTEYTKYIPELWDAYVRVNQKFCDTILQHASDGDILWIHDYQLLLVPMMLREKLPNATIGFFQHIPFPSYEIFRLLPWREKILEGMLGADLIGFHTYDDMRHFLSSVSRILGHGSTMGQIRLNNRIVGVDSFPMGIDYEKFTKATHSPETIDKLKKYFQILSNQKVVLSIDRLDYTKGIKQRLEAFDMFLEKYPQYLGKVSIILIVVPSRVKVDQYNQLKNEIDTIVGRLNGKYSRMDWNPIHYFYRSFSFHALSALYSSAEVALITPLRDGMNLVCKEYIASKLDKRGVLILSEMAGAAKELSEAILINPNDSDQLVEAMHQALEMPEEEQIARNEEMQNKLKRYNIHRWVEVFMQQLDKVKELQVGLNLKLVTGKTLDKIVKHYSEAESRLILLDYDGTLKPFASNPKAVKPDEELINLLTKLTEDPKNRVVIISGRDKSTLEEWVGHLKIDLIAEHGVWLKKLGAGWSTIELLDQGWKEKIRSILDLYVDRTPGSFIEDKDYSLVWHYRKADTDFGELRARELLSNINYLIANMDLQTMEGNKVIEIKSRAVNKGKAASKWLNEGKYDFVFAIGDDVTDEDTFAAMPDTAYTVKVGLTATVANYNVKSPEEVREVLNTFADTK
ncbi:bifunctional alpha,alpha-trehalose-phosphate synthase (UDP-forming)/trehalose-phosphatase [Chondrinema litorale]|uniref:bifunctional alpha,alpha-trehalose-phosphate synthase (UDP-forming)/trehalose-phosphatase n=1 Tax=Chondrinema litorale TaxID=2994555 RepID=UPI002544695B|nr:bifunctional alpha,alpha-trehalose-phosphate synthase (UDP-forming)/trehalose-phosphatase [Chondrinema litorale]UZR92339.1 bifunctional alpha,alpha-trehalose-phosphate synthase (UDP-forming)/trehalose-phosphatase [Chondrinema litorale]